jgi:hypothetical protein
MIAGDYLGVASHLESGQCIAQALQEPSALGTPCSSRLRETPRRMRLGEYVAVNEESFQDSSTGRSAKHSCDSSKARLPALNDIIIITKPNGHASRVHRIVIRHRERLCPDKGFQPRGSHRQHPEDAPGSEDRSAEGMRTATMRRCWLGNLRGAPSHQLCPRTVVSSRWELDIVDTTHRFGIPLMRSSETSRRNLRRAHN